MMVLALCAVTMVVGCGSSTRRSVDAGMMRVDAGDASMMTVDAGDAGAPGTDAGNPETDAGVPEADAGTMTGGACTNTADTTVLMTVDIAMIVEGCARSTLGMATSVTNDCFQMGSGLSTECTACFGDSVSCLLMNCVLQCIGGGSSPGCVSCRATNCDPAFAECSGVSAM